MPQAARLWTEFLFGQKKLWNADNLEKKKNRRATQVRVLPHDSLGYGLLPGLTQVGVIRLEIRKSPTFPRTVPFLVSRHSTPEASVSQSFVISPRATGGSCISEAGMRLIDR
jgi:hypothetical protein